MPSQFSRISQNICNEFIIKLLVKYSNNLSQHSIIIYNKLKIKHLKNVISNFNKCGKVFMTNL